MAVRPRTLAASVAPVIVGTAVAESIGAFRPVALHGELALPTLWIAGVRDPKYVAEARRAAALAPNATLEIVDGAAHRVPWERPDAVVASLRRFLGGR